jgi:hypothetical protein
VATGAQLARAVVETLRRRPDPSETAGVNASEHGPAKRIYRTADRMRDRKLWRGDENDYTGDLVYVNGKSADARHGGCAAGAR